MNKKGCPPGGRVHWLLYRLSREFSSNYSCSYNYSYHNYFFMRKLEFFSKKNLVNLDIFIVCRTSKHCWRVSGHNLSTGETIVTSFQYSNAVAEFLDETSKAWQKERADKTALSSL